MARVSAELRMVCAGTAIGCIGHDARLLAPAKIGDELTITWTVTAFEPRPKHGGGSVVADAGAGNQHGGAVCTTRGWMRVGDRPGG